MGAHPLDYARISPPNSFIHVDWFANPRELAEYLLAIDKDNARYNTFHMWRNSWKPLWPNFHCLLCFVVQFIKIEGIHTHIPNIERWLRNYDLFEETPDLCIGNNSWVFPLSKNFLPD